MIETEDCEVLELKSLLGIEECKSQPLQAFLEVDKTRATEMVSGVKGKRTRVEKCNICRYTFRY